MKKRIKKIAGSIACMGIFLGFLPACSSSAPNGTVGSASINVESISTGTGQEEVFTDDTHLLEMRDRLMDSSIPYIVHSLDGFGGVGEGKRVEVDESLLQTIADTLAHTESKADNSTQFDTLPGTIEVYGGDMYLSIQKLGSPDSSAAQSGTLLNLQMDNNTEGKEGFYANYIVDDDSIYDTLLDAAQKRFVDDTVEIVSGDYSDIELPGGYQVAGMIQGEENLVLLACKDTGADTQSRDYCLYYFDPATGEITDTVEVGDGTFTIESCAYKQYDFRLQSFGDTRFQYYSTQDPQDTITLSLPDELDALVHNETTGDVGFDADAGSSIFAAAGTTTLMVSAAGAITTIDISEAPTDQILGFDKEKATIVFSSVVLVDGGKYVLAGFYLPNGLKGDDEPHSPGYLLYNTASGDKNWLIHIFLKNNSAIAFPGQGEVVGWKWLEDGEEPGLVRLDLDTLDVTDYPGGLPKDYTLDDVNINYEYWADYTSENLGDGSADITIDTYHDDSAPKEAIKFHASAADKQVWIQGLTQSYILIGLNDGTGPVSRTILVQYQA